MDLKSTYNKIAKDWHTDHIEDDWWIDGTDKFIAFLGRGDWVLDVGSGGGIKSHYLVRNGLKVLGIDFSENQINIAKVEAPEAEFQIMDMRDVSNLTQEFSGIFIQASLLHIPKDEAESVLKSLASKLKVGGYFYVAVKEARQGSPDEEVRKKNDYGYEYERFFSYFSMDELNGYFRRLNLQVVYEEVHPSGKTNWLQIIGRKL